MENLNDENLVELVQKGDIEMFGSLVERYEQKMLRYAGRFLFDHDNAQDAVQEVFIKAYTNIASFDLTKRFSPWLYRIAHNYFINEILNGTVTNTSVEEQKEVLDQMKEQKIFDLTETEKTNLINFLCEEVDTELSVDYLFHVLDSEISYPIDDEKVKSLFEDDRMRKLKDVMMDKLQDDEVGEVSSEEDV